MVGRWQAAQKRASVSGKQENGSAAFTANQQTAIHPFVKKSNHECIHMSKKVSSTVNLNYEKNILRFAICQSIYVKKSLTQATLLMISCMNSQENKKKIIFRRMS